MYSLATELFILGGRILCKNFQAKEGMGKMGLFSYGIHNVTFAFNIVMCLTFKCMYSKTSI